MKLQGKSIEKFLRNGEDNFGFDEEADELEVSRVQPMRSFETKNKKQDALMYKTPDAKRYFKRK